MKLISANGDHGQIVQLHVVKESKEGQEHVRMMLIILVSHSMSKEVASFLQLIGSHGQAVQQHVIVVSKQEQEHVLTIKRVPPMSQKLTKKIVEFKNAAMTLGLHIVIMIHVPIVEWGHIKNNVHDVNLSKLRVHKKANRLNTNMTRKIVIIMATGEPVNSKRGICRGDSMKNPQFREICEQKKWCTF